MQHVLRLTFTLLFAITLGGTSWVRAAVQKETEYKRSDTNFYWKGDVMKADPTAVIIPAGGYTQKGDSYFFTPKKKAPKEIYIQVENDWIEPITPPDMPASLGVKPDEMQIRDPQGDVQVALPSAPGTYVPVQNGMVVPNGTVVKTGANGTAAVLFGGVESARLTPDTSAAVQQTVTPNSRSTEVDLHAGAVFSKVGKQVGVTEDYQVKTPFGVAAARGTDFVTVALPARTDAWIAQGTVQLDAPDGKTVGVVQSEGAGPLKIIRYPAMPDLRASMMASAETMTTAMNFIPMANVNVKALKDRLAKGDTLTANETKYLSLIKHVPCLIRLARVDVTAVSAPAPGVVPPVAAATPAAPAPAPVNLDVRTDGKVDFQEETLSLEALQPKLEAVAKATPNQPIVIRPADASSQKLVKKIQRLCRAAKLKATVDNTIADKAAADKAAADKAAADKAAADKAAAKKAAADKAAADKAAAKKAAEDKALADKAAADKAAADAKLPPVELVVHADGKIDFEGATLSEDDLKPKLAELAGTSPNRPVVITRKETLEKGALRKVRDLCRAAKLTNVSLGKPVAAPSDNSTPPATPLPMKMGPSPMTSDSGTSAAKPKKAQDAPAPISNGPNDTVP